MPALTLRPVNNEPIAGNRRGHFSLIMLLFDAVCTSEVNLASQPGCVLGRGEW